MCALSFLILACGLKHSWQSQLSQSLHHITAKALSSHSPHLISCSWLACRGEEPSCRLLKISINCFVEKLVGIGADVGRSLSRHSGQRASSPDCLLVRMVDLTHSSQNVCKHGIVLGSVKMSWQMEQVISSSIAFHSSLSDPCTKDSE